MDHMHRGQWPLPWQTACGQVDLMGAQGWQRPIFLQVAVLMGTAVPFSSLSASPGRGPTQTLFLCWSCSAGSPERGCLWSAGETNRGGRCLVSPQLLAPPPGMGRTSLAGVLSQHSACAATAPSLLRSARCVLKQACRLWGNGGHAGHGHILLSTA